MSGPDRAPRPRASELGYRNPIPYRAVFEFFPHGILVTDADSHIQGYNRTARRLLGDTLERDRLRCCDLFGCNRAGTPLADHCITHLALGHPGPMPEVRVDVAGRGQVKASVWITGSPIGGSEPTVVLTMRPGVVGDRRKRTEPHWMGGPRLRIFALGRTRVESGEGPLAGEWLGHRPGEVLKYLICHRGRVVPLEELLEVFWPQSGRSGATNVRQAVHTLRDHLEPARERHAASTFVAARKGGYELDQANVWMDADDFEDSARAGLAAVTRDDLDEAEAELTRAAALYRGDFLADEPYAEWVFAERDRLRDMAGQVLRGLAQVKIAYGDLEAATEQHQRLAELEPLDMDAQRDLIALLLRRGKHAEAHRRHEVVRRRYQKTFGEDPPFDLATLQAENTAG